MDLARLLQRMNESNDNDQEFVEVKLEHGEEAEEEWEYELEGWWEDGWESNESSFDGVEPASQEAPPPPPPHDPMPPPPPPPPPSEWLEGSRSQGVKGPKGSKNSKSRPKSPKGKGGHGQGKGTKGKKGWTEPTTAAFATARYYQRQIYKGDGRGGLYVRGGFVDKSGYFHQQ